MRHGDSVGFCGRLRTEGGVRWCVLCDEFIGDWRLRKEKMMTLAKVKV